MISAPTALDIARALIAFPSVTPADAGALPICAICSSRAGFAARSSDLQGAGDAGRAQSLRPLRSGGAEPRLRRPYRRRAARRRRALAVRSVLGEVADGQLWGRGACDMKGGVAAAVAAALRFVAGDAARRVTGLDQLPRHRRRGRAGDQRHGQAARLGAAQGASASIIASLGEPTSVAALGDTIKNGRRGSLTGRLTLHRQQGHVAYPHLADNPIRALAPVLAALHGAAARRGQRRTSSRQPRSRQRRRRQSRGQRHSGRGPARLQHPLQRRWTPETLAAEIAAAGRGGGGRQALHADLRSDQCDRVSDQRGPFTDLVADAVEDVTGRRPNSRPAGAPPTRASSRTSVRWSNSASSTRPCMPSTSGSRSRISRG